MYIENKIDEFVNKYSGQLPEFTKKIFLNDKNCIKKTYNLNNFSKTNIVLNYAEKNQSIFNYIFNCTVNETIFFLNQPIDFFISRLEEMKLNNKKIIIPFENDVLFENVYYKKLVYIVFLYLGIQRKIIYYLQEKYVDFNSQYGKISIDFYNSKTYSMSHPLSMTRLKNYLNRISENLNLIKNNHINLKEEVKILRDDIINFKIFFYNNNFLDDSEKKTYFYINLYDQNYEKNILINIERVEKIENYAQNPPYINISSYYSLGNKSISLESRKNLLGIMVKILYILDTIKNTKNEELNIKDCILSFYYILILLMPFKLGTASIAEMILHSLWRFYLNKKIIINKNTMIDVEALTLPYSLFKNNCFANEENNKYVPYFEEIDL